MPKILVPIDAFTIAKAFTIRVRIVGAKRLAWRVQIARWLLGIVARVCPMSIEITETQ